MTSQLSAEALTARLNVVLSFVRGEDAARALEAWLSVETVDPEMTGIKLLEAVSQVIGDDRAMALVLFASASFRLELVEAIDGGR